MPSTMNTMNPQQSSDTSPRALRPYSSPPTDSPSLTIPSFKPTERSVSASSVESATSRCSSVVSRSSDAVSRRRGYARPQATNFADSARNRESVLSLGTIAHLQYYFARTGLLDGKGAQLYRKTENKSSPVEDGVSNFLSAPKRRSDSDSTYSSMRSSPDLGLPQDQENQLDARIVESPIQEDYVEGYDGDAETIMLPPTVSTYNHRPKHVPRPPQMDEMRRELKEALVDATKVLQDAEKEEAGRLRAPSSGDSSERSPQDPAVTTPPSTAASSEDAFRALESGNETPTTSTPSSDSQGWHEVQGMHILDLMTLAIRAAKIYYTAHEQPGKLSAIRSERKIREEFLMVMDTLKRMASRNFAGGLRKSERLMMQGWIEGVRELLGQEEDRERQEQQERESWVWMSDGWEGREREREWSFLRSFDASPDALPSWTPPDDHPTLPSPFLLALQNGVRLIRLHNTMTAKSKRPFGQISNYHTDTSKPYRCAENIRFWIKAVELRWEILLKFDVMGVVYGRDAAAWKAFDAEILRWCGHVRESFTREWKEQVAKQVALHLPEDSKTEAVVHWEEACKVAEAPWAR